MNFMAEVNVLVDFINVIKEFYNSLAPMPKSFVTLFSLVILIVIYAVFVWKLHEFISRKNIFRFDLNQYNKSGNPTLSKIIASAFYLLEYTLIIPFIIFFWFLIFTFFLIFLIEESITIETILIISAIVVASIRMSSYIPGYGENVARELAKLLPFTFLGIAILEPNVFTNLIPRVGSRISELPEFFSGAIGYLVFIVFLEVILRFFEFIFNITEMENEEEPVKN